MTRFTTVVERWLLLLLCVGSQVVVAVPLWSDVCTQEAVRELPFCNTSLPINNHVLDYTKRVPVESMILMMNNKAQGFEPLSIPPYQWWSEGLHGPLEACVTYKDRCACPTSFPCPSALGNAFNSTLYHEIGTAIGTEGRAISNLKPHSSEIGDGLTYWSPTLNMQRDPRWGRNQEVPGEDPFLTSQYVSNFVRGLQGDDARLRVGAACKHFVANSLENWGNHTRHNFDAHVSLEDLFNYYFPPFRECTKQAAGVMCSYNALNGVPTCVNNWLLREILRGKWDFDGYVVSDCGALDDVVTGHHFTIDATQASAMAVNASVDLNCGNGDYYPNGLMQAFEENWVQASTVKESFKRLVMIQFRLGLFDPKVYNPEDDINHVGSHGELALSAAQQSIVLLKNEGNLLPLEPKQKLLLIGPHLNATEALLSNYHGDSCGCTSCSGTFDCIQTPLEAIEKMNQQPVIAVKACNIDGDDLNEIDKATQAAQEADVVLLLVGLDQSQESEGLDRNETTLPGLQPTLIESVLRVASEKTVLILIHGGAVSLGDFVCERAAAILSMPYGGQAASQALSTVLEGSYNPTGKLAATMYPPSYVQDLPMTDMTMSSGNGRPGRTHIYYHGPVEFPFGHGLSYSSWHLELTKNQQLRGTSDSLREKEIGHIEIAVYNTGPIAGSQSVLLFWLPSSDLVKTRQKLLSFQGTGYLHPGQSEVLKFVLHEKDFMLWDDPSHEMVVPSERCTLVAKAANTQLTMTLQFPQTNTASVDTMDHL